MLFYTDRPDQLPTLKLPTPNF